MNVCELQDLWDLEESGATIKGVFRAKHGLAYYFFEDGIQIGAAYQLPAGQQGWKAFYPWGSYDFTIRLDGGYFEELFESWEDAYTELWLRYVNPLAQAKDVLSNCIDKG